MLVRIANQCATGQRPWGAPPASACLRASSCASAPATVVPARQVLLGDAAQGANPRVGVVQARDVVELLATVVQEGLALPC